MALGILLILSASVMLAQAILIHVVVLDCYPILYGMHFFFYGVALIFVVWGIVEIVRYVKRRKRRISRGQIAKGLKIQSKLSIIPTKTSDKSSIYGGQSNLTSKSLRKDKTPVKSNIFGGQSKNKR